jgi:hypothetical protein
MKTQIQSVSKIVNAAELAARINQVGADLVAIAKDLVAAIDLKESFKDELAKQGINRELIRRLERVGRAQIDERLILATGPAVRLLMACPLSEQRKILTDGIEVMEADEKTVRKIQFESLTFPQIQRVFAQGHIRDLGEQRTWIRNNRNEMPTPEPADEYKVFKDHVVTRKPGVWTKQMILGWLQQMG